jgi:hypothetical protein
MDTPEILSLIDAEIATLEQARALIVGAAPKKSAGRPIGTGKKNKRRNLSPEGRARIAAAVKARWAAQKKAAK